MITIDIIIIIIWMLSTIKCTAIQGIIANILVYIGKIVHVHDNRVQELIVIYEK